jgi:rubredoxin
VGAVADLDLHAADGHRACVDHWRRCDEARGDAHEGFAPGTTWAQVPADWACPDCAVNEKADFKIVGQDGKAAGPR